MVDLVPRLPDEVLVVDLLATAAALRPETPGKRGHDDFRPLAEVDVKVGKVIRKKVGAVAKRSKALLFRDKIN